MITSEEWSGLDESKLVPATRLQPEHRLTSATSAAFCAMSEAALLDGMTITIASSYRPFARQARIWNDKFNGLRPVLNDQSIPITDWDTLDEEHKIHAILRWSALPGSSRHHWGTDLDVYSQPLLPADYKLQLIPAEYDIHTGCFASLTRWLDAHQHQFGFFRPFQIEHGGVAPEPWHLSFQSESQKYCETCTLAGLQAILKAHPIAGQATLMSILPELWERYVLPTLRNNDR